MPLVIFAAFAMWCRRAVNHARDVPLDQRLSPLRPRSSLERHVVEIEGISFRENDGYSALTEFGSSSKRPNRNGRSAPTDPWLWKSFPSIVNALAVKCLPVWLLLDPMARESFGLQNLMSDTHEVTLLLAEWAKGNQNALQRI